MKTKVWAHRGASAYAPENTLEAFLLAAEQGADGVELDVQLTKDGEMVVVHDEEIDRVSDGSGFVKDYTLAELKTLNFNKTHPEYQDVKIPTLREVYEALKPTGMTINVELKTGIFWYKDLEKKVLELTKEMEMEDRVIYSSFNHYSIAKILELDPKASTGILYADVIYDVVNYAKKIGTGALHPATFHVQMADFLQQYVESDLAVHVWTVNDKAEIERLMDAGVDAVITNYPEKWRTLAKAIEWQKNNYDILQNAMFIGGNPEENNIYGYFSWNDNGDGIIALRNPTDEKTSLTLTLNKLMGCPESLKDVKRYNVYNQSNKESFDSFSYGDKIDLALQPFEIKIFQFGSEDKRYPNREAVTDFTVSFNYKGEENIEIAHNDDIDISIVKGYVNIKCGRCHLRSNSIVSGGAHKITVVREKSKALKLYIDRKLDASGYDSRAKAKINTVIDSDAEDFNVIEKATPYDEIITLKNILAGVGKRKLFK